MDLEKKNYALFGKMLHAKYSSTDMIHQMNKSQASHWSIPEK